MRQQRSICGHHNDDRANVRAMGIKRNLVAHRDASDAKEMAGAKITLDEYANRVATKGIRELARRGACSALEFEADHSRTAAHVALCNGSRMCVLHSGVCVFRLYVETIDVVQVTIPSLRHNRKRPPVFEWNRGSVFQLPVDHRVPYHSYAVRVGDHHRAVEKAGLVDPNGASHLAIAILSEPPCEYRIHPGFSARKNCRDTSANRADTDLKLPFAANQSLVADLNPFDVCNRIQRAGRSFKWNAEIASTRSDLGGRDKNGANEGEKNYKGKILHRRSSMARDWRSFSTC